MLLYEKLAALRRLDVEARRLERALAYGESLFDKHRIVVVSTDLIKSPRHRDDFVAHCPDLVIVDEAHTCVPTDGAGARTAQLRYELLSMIETGARPVGDEQWRHRSRFAKALTWVAYGCVRAAMGMLRYGGNEWWRGRG